MGEFDEAYAHMIDTVSLRTPSQHMAYAASLISENIMASADAPGMGSGLARVADAAVGAIMCAAHTPLYAAAQGLTDPRRAEARKLVVLNEHASASFDAPWCTHGDILSGSIAEPIIDQYVSPAAVPTAHDYTLTPNYGTPSTLDTSRPTTVRASAAAFGHVRALLCRETTVVAPWVRCVFRGVCGAWVPPGSFVRSSALGIIVNSTMIPLGIPGALAPVVATSLWGPARAETQAANQGKSREVGRGDYTA